MKEEAPSIPSGSSRRSGRRHAIEEVVRHLHRIFKVVDTFSRRTLAEFGVSGPQIWALRTIEASGSLTMGELAGALFLHMSTVTGIVDRLEGRRLVVRERFGEDRGKERDGEGDPPARPGPAVRGFPWSSETPRSRRVLAWRRPPWRHPRRGLGIYGRP